MIIDELKKLIDKKLILYSSNGFRFEVKILDVGNDGFIKIADLRKLNVRFMKIADISEWEVLDD